MEAKEKVRFVDKVADILRKAAVELEEFELQAALGKAEAQDKYEEAKKKLYTFIHETRVDADTKLEVGKEKLEEVQQKMDELNVQLALGKAETVERLKEQKKQILLAVHELETKIKTNDKLKRAYAYTLIELDMFKLQMEILEDTFREGKKDFSEAFAKGKDKLNNLVKKVKEETDGDKLEARWENFQNEMSETFSHLRDVFSK